MNCPVDHGGVTPEGSESENPALDSPQPQAHRPHSNRDWWPNQLDLSVLRQHGARETRRHRGVQDARDRSTYVIHVVSPL
jgi:catalase (peroxidase I)